MFTYCAPDIANACLPGKMSTTNSKKKLRSSVTVNISNKKNQDVVQIPNIDKFQSTRLPLTKEVIGMVFSIKDQENVDFDIAMNKVTQIVMEHWKNQNVYTKTRKSVKQKLQTFVSEYRILMKINTSKGKPLERCKKFNEIADKLFDIHSNDSARVMSEGAKANVPMGSDELSYLKSMQTDRGYTCANVDKVFHKKQEEKERKAAKQLANQSSCFSTVSTDIAIEDDESDVELRPDDIKDFESEGETNPTGSTKKRRSFDDISSVSTKSLRSTRLTSVSTADNCSHIQYVRSSMNHVHDEIYETFAELDGHNFSYHESQLAIKIVANRLFGRNWKIPEEKSRISKYDEDDEQATTTTPIDNNTLPTRSTVRSKLKQMHAMSLKLIGNRIVEAKKEGSLLTHATDSTSRKHVGTFAPAGVHVNRDEYIPLPTLSISSETTKSVAEAIETDFKMVAVAAGMETDELYANIDLHMTDATNHNKGISVEAAKLMNREIPAGQLFCNPHTALGFDRGMEAVVNGIEVIMGMDQLLKCFLLTVDIDQKRDTVSLTFVSWVLSLFGPDNIEKPWNYHKDLNDQLKREDRPMHLFQLKDMRFGLLSQSCARVFYHWNDFCTFFESLDYVTNKLACLCRDAMNLPHIRLVAATLAAFGIHLVSPFFAQTKGKSTHTELQAYFTEVHSSLLNDTIDESFFEFNGGYFRGISSYFVQSIKKNEYGVDVAFAVTETAHDSITDAVKLANKIRVKMAEVLSQQRGSYYGFGGKEKQFYVFDQAEDVDRAITNNLEQERQCGDTAQRLKKKPSIPTVSRGVILKRTTEMRDENPNPSEFRKMGPVVKAIEKINSEWTAKQDELRRAGCLKKEAQKLHVDQRKLDILERLKAAGGPFSNSEQVEVFVNQVKDTKKERKLAQKRLREEVTYARDTSVSLPRAHLLFKMFGKDPSTNKRRLKTVEEFAQSLKVLLGNASERATVTLDDFQRALGD